MTLAQQKKIEELQKQVSQEKKANKKKKGGQGRRSRRARGSGQPAGIVAAAADYVNPFSPMIHKVPDEFSGKSSSIRIRQAFSLVPDATYGTAALLLKPRLKSGLYVAPTISASGTITSWGSSSDNTDYTSTDASFDRYRIVSWGVRITSVGSVTNSQGLLTVQTHTNDSGAPSVPFQATASAMRRDTYPVNQNLDVAWVSEPLHNRAREFVPVATTAQEFSYNFTYPAIWVTGSTATNSINVEMFMNLELLGLSGTVGERLGTAAAPENNGFLHVVRQVYQGMGSTFNVLGHDLRNSSFLQNAAQRAVNWGAQQAVAQGVRFFNQSPGAARQPRIVY